MNLNQIPEDLTIDDTEREFNSQIEYFKMLYRIQERRNIAYEAGIGIDGLLFFFRSVRSLLSCSAPKLKQEGSDVAQLKDKLKGLWSKLISLLGSKDEILKARNLRLYEFELMEISDELNQMIHEAGIIYPKKVKKTIEQAREEDY